MPIINAYDSIAGLLLLGSVFGLISLVGILILFVLYFRSIRHYRILTRGISKRQDLAKLLEGHLQKLDATSSNLSHLEEEVRRIKKEAQRHVQRVGLLRFNPFGDTGGDQSFAISLLDGENDGVVISSLHGRAATRVYAKPVKKGGESGYRLSEEEKEAVRQAVGH